MKRKSIVIIAILLVLQLCSSLSALPTTASEAELVVQGWLKTDSQPLETEIGQEVREVEIFTNDNGDPLYYVVYLDPSGFVIVSADDAIEPIIGFADDGTYDPSLDNPLGTLVTNDLNRRMASIQNSISLMTVMPQTQVSNTQKKWNYLLALAETSEGGFSLMGLNRISNVRVAPLVRSKWDQAKVYSSSGASKNCYNYYTPNNYPSGCTATAMAQLMRYYEHPRERIGRKSFQIKVNGYDDLKWTRGGDSNGGSYIWDLMVLEPSYNTQLDKRKAIGALCYDAGISINTDYTVDGSSSNLFKAREALLNTFQYENAISGLNYDYFTETLRDLGSGLTNMVNPNLDAGYPVILGLTGPDGGHAVLADGYGYNFSTLYYHLNIGWSGNHDAYYNLPTIDSNPSFNVVDECVYNIFTSGKGEIISGRVTDESGNPIRGAIVTAIESQHNPEFIIPVEIEDPQEWGMINSSYSDETNDKGIYAISGLNSNTMYTLNVNKTGHNFDSTVVTTGQSRDIGSVSGNRWGIDFIYTTAFIFEDTFSTSYLDRTKWTQSSYPVTVRQNSLQLGADYSFPGRIGQITQSGFGSITSKFIDLSQYLRASFTCKHKLNTDHSESDLVFKYWNGSDWKELSTLEGDHQDQANTYKELTIPLPSDALHAEFRLSISRSWVIPEIHNIGKSVYINYGDWSIDDVKIIPTH